jgi:hypothetical protein
VHHHQVEVGQLHARVELGQLGVVPVDDPPHEDVDQRVAVEMQLDITDRGEIVGHDHGAEHRGHMEHVGVHRRDLALVHRPIAGPEVDRTLGELADTAAGADRLIVDLHAGLPVVGVEPLGVDRIGEGRPGAGEALGRRRSAGTGREADQRRRDPKGVSHDRVLVD